MSGVIRVAGVSFVVSMFHRPGRHGMACRHGRVGHPMHGVRSMRFVLAVRRHLVSGVIMLHGVCSVLGVIVVVISHTGFSFQARLFCLAAIRP